MSRRGLLVVILQPLLPDDPNELPPKTIPAWQSREPIR